MATKQLVFESIKQIHPTQFELLKSFDNNSITTLDFFNNTIVDNFSRSVLEKAKNMDLIEAKYLWYDIGGFDSLFEILAKLNLNDKINEINKLLK